MKGIILLISFIAAYLNSSNAQVNRDTVLGVGFRPTQMAAYPNQNVALPWYVNTNYMKVEEHLVYGPGSRLIRGCEGRFARKPCHHNVNTATRERCEAWRCCWDETQTVVCAEPRYIIWKLEEPDETAQSTCGIRPEDAGRLPQFGGGFGILGLLLGFSSRVLAGGAIPVDQGDWPWMVRVIFPTNNLQPTCGGVLVHSRYVLSAAHCFCTGPFCGPTFLPANLAAVVVNEQDITMDSYFDTVYPVESYTVHPDHDLNGAKNFDLAVIKISVPPNSRQRATICLPPPGFDVGAAFSNGPKCIALGWGARDGGSTLNDLLQGVALQVWTDSACQATATFPPVLPGQAKICAGGVLGEDTCGGDSGGPLMCQGDDARWYVQGIVSYGPNPCGQANKPGIYTKISAAVDYINSIIT